MTNRKRNYFNIIKIIKKANEITAICHLIQSKRKKLFTYIHTFLTFQTNETFVKFKSNIVHYFNLISNLYVPDLQSITFFGSITFA